MASKGNLYLNNSDINNMFTEVQKTKESVNTAFYDHYKTSYKISLSNYFRGVAADGYKSYVTNVSLNALSGLMDLNSEILMGLELIQKAFIEYEAHPKGQVDEPVLDYIDREVKSRESTFNGAQPILSTTLGEAAQYITTQSLQLNEVNQAYTDVKTKMKDVREKLEQTDDDCLTHAKELLTRINEVKTQIEKMRDYCYNGDTIKPDSFATISQQPWYKKQTNVTLQMNLQKDPFAYAAGSVTVAEDQWAAGYTSDIYAYAGYSICKAEGEAGIENGTAFAKGKVALIEANGYAQFTKYATAQANLKVFYGEGEAKAGFSKDYMGVGVEGEIGYAKVDASAVLGTDNINLNAKASAELLTADGKAAFNVQKDGQYELGAKGSATLASASASIGTSTWGVPQKNAEGKYETINLLGIEAEATASIGVSGAAYAESKTAIETKYFNVNASSMELEGVLGIGGKIKITVPTLHFKWPF